MPTPGCLREAPAVGALFDYLDRGRQQGHEPLPMFAGGLAFRSAAPTILVCAHLAGPYLFGAEISFLDILDALDRLGMNTLVCLPGVHHAGYFAQVRQRSTQVAVLPYGWWKQGVSPCEPMVMNFRRLMQDQRVDLVYLNTVVLDEPIWAAKALKLPVVVHVRELPEHDPALCGLLGARAEEIRERLLTWADSLVANSQTVKRYLQGSNIKECSVFPPVDVVPDIVLCPDFDLTLSDGNVPFNVGMISSNIPKKGVADFIELARALASLSPQIRCLLVGPGNGNDHRSACATDLLAGCQETSSSVAMRQRHRKPCSQIHVVVNLSQVEESFGRTVLEAMAARRPVVCYDRGALAELVVDGETGFLVPPGEVATAAERIHLLSQNPEMRARMGEAARMRAHRGVLVPRRSMLHSPACWHASQ
jgi:glycosyltransferase involved in cell wall biosynthesis